MGSISQLPPFGAVRFSSPLRGTRIQMRHFNSSFGSKPSRLLECLVLQIVRNIKYRNLHEYLIERIRSSFILFFFSLLHRDDRVNLVQMPQVADLAYWKT